MPYKKIVWIKLFLDLITEDDRFLYQLNESQQLLYIKLLLLAGITNNKITKNPRFICHKINYHHEEECFLRDMARLQEVFPKLSVEGEYYHFKNFHNLHNYIGNSKGTPKELPKEVLGSDQIEIKNKIEIRKDYIGRFTPPSIETVRTYCAERKNSVNAEAFVNHYQAKGWMIGKNKMKDWQAAVRTWEKSSPVKSDRHYA